MRHAEREIVDAVETAEVVTPTVAIDVRPLAGDARESIAALVSQDDDLPDIFLIRHRSVGEEVVVTPAVAVGVGPLLAVFRERVVLVGPAVTVAVRATLASVLVG